jgi:hypothetical protein
MLVAALDDGGDESAEVGERDLVQRRVGGQRDRELALSYRASRAERVFVEVARRDHCPCDRGVLDRLLDACLAAEVRDRGAVCGCDRGQDQPRQAGRP